MLIARNVSVTIDRQRIIEGIDFAAAAGQVTAIVGPNGSGKSTLLKALCNDLPHDGSISLNGRDLRHLRPYEAASMRAVLPQTATLTFPFTVHEVVRMGLVAGVSGATRSAEAHLSAEALARVDLAGFGGRLYQSLSGGEQQRVQLARVLCQVWAPVLDGTPRFLLLDEPVSSLDIKHQLIIMDIARDFARQGGGVIAILHDLNLATLYADRIVAMRAGRIAAVVEPGEVLGRDLVRAVFDCDLESIDRPGGGRIFTPPAPSARVFA